MATEKTPLRGEQYASDAQKRKRIVGITGAVVVLAAIIVVLWLTLSGHSSKSTEVTGPTTPKPAPALRPEAPANAVPAKHEAPTHPAAEPAIPVPAHSQPPQPPHAIPVPAAVPQPPHAQPTTAHATP
ncbi:unnamed protein product [Peronospora belbahrii]|uniref:Uncharacterized protein n=1 Tax=Peronospora belbahrii TaxID=622444 RepID=A0AAU9L951_9STRA|nr:unnamed protein product [Peronospora belbahrii]